MSDDDRVGVEVEPGSAEMTRVWAKIAMPYVERERQRMDAHRALKLAEFRAMERSSDRLLDEIYLADLNREQRRVRYLKWVLETFYG